MLLLFSLCLFWQAKSFSQDPYFTIITESDGLPSNEVYDIYQDKTGFIWVCTNSGLSRFDGVRFKTYYSPELSSLPGSNIFQDTEGRIWYENFDGNNYFIQNDSLHVLPQDSAGTYLRSAQVGKFIAVPSARGIQLYDVKTLAKSGFVPLKGGVISTRLGESQFLVVYNDHRQNKIMIGWLKENGSFVDLYSVDDDIGKTRPEPVEVSGKIYLVERIARVNPTQASPAHSSGHLPIHSSMSFIQAFEVIDQKIWLADITGMILFDTQKKAYETERKILGDNSISAIMKDREGNIWLGTLGKGMIFIPDFDSRFLHPAQIPLTKISVSENSLFVGTQDGIVFRYDKGESDVQVMYEKKDRHAIDALQYFPEKKILLAGSPEADAIFPFSGEKTIPGYGIPLKEAVYLSEKYYAAATSNDISLIRFPGVDSSENDPWDSLFIARFSNNFLKSASILLGRGRTICKAEGKDEIFTGSATGLFCITPNRILELKLNGKKVLPAKLAYHNGYIYGLSTLGECFVVTPEKNVVSLEGLPERGPFQFMKIDNGHFFLLSWFNLYEGKLSGTKVSEVHEIAGVNPNRVNDLAIWQGKLALSTDEGLILLNLNKQTQAGTKPQLVINTCMISGKKFPASEHPVMAYHENELLIDYSILSYRTGGKFPFWYRINNGQWTLTPTEMRTLVLPSLEPGDYTIEFRLGDMEGKADGKISFTIRKPFWLQPWFLITIAFLMFSFIALMFTLRTRRIQKEEKEKLRKQELESDLRQSKLSALRSQMNPHFFFNALNTIQAYIVNGDKANASGYLVKFSRLTRMVLEMSEKEFVTLADEIQALTLYLELETSRFGEPFQFSVFIDDSIKPEKILVPSLFIQPFCENAVKHGLLHKRGEKMLALSFRISGEWLEVTVDDNGIGRQRSMELNQKKPDKPKSFSTDATLRRVDLLNRETQKVKIEYTDKTGPSGEPTGTLVKILIKPQTNS